MMLRESPKRKPLKGDSTDAQHRGGATRSSEEGSVMELERRGCTVWPYSKVNRIFGRSLVSKTKSFSMANATAGGWTVGAGRRETFTSGSGRMRG